MIDNLRGGPDRVMNWTRGVAYSPDGTRLAAGYKNGLVRLWDVKTGRIISTLDGHTDVVTSVVFSSDSTRLASGSDDGTIRMWNAKPGRFIAVMEGHSGTNIAFSRDGTRLASGSVRRILVATGDSRI